MRTDDGGVQSFLQDDLRGLRVGDRIQLSSERETRYATGERPYDAPVGRIDERELQPQSYRVDARGQRHDVQGNRVDERGYRVEDRGYRRDEQGYWVDAHGNRYDAQGYWVDERGIRHEHQDAPRPYQVPATN